MSQEPIKLEPKTGDYVLKFIKSAITEAESKNCPVTFEIDKYPFYLTESSDAEEAYSQYMEVTDPPEVKATIELF